MKYVRVIELEKLKDRTPTQSHISGLDLVVIRYDENVSVLYGRCQHRGALMADGHIDGDNLICGSHDNHKCHLTK